MNGTVSMFDVLETLELRDLANMFADVTSSYETPQDIADEVEAIWWEIIALLLARPSLERSETGHGTGIGRR